MVWTIWKRHTNANDNFGGWHSDFNAMVNQFAKSGGVSAAIVKLLRPKRGDLTLLKPMHSAFFGSPLDIILKKIGARSLVITGLVTDVCVQMTAADAFLRDLRIHIPPECTIAENDTKKLEQLYSPSTSINLYPTAQPTVEVIVTSTTNIDPAN